LLLRCDGKEREREAGEVEMRWGQRKSRRRSKGEWKGVLGTLRRYREKIQVCWLSEDEGTEGELVAFFISTRRFFSDGGL
jgi:hypothetical protein